LRYTKAEPFPPGGNALLVKLSDQGTSNEQFNIASNCDVVKEKVR
jgi:hypothetical protein